MNSDLIQKMQSQFDELVQTHPDEAGLEFWFARDLQTPLGYARWENFQTAISRGIESCKTTGYDPEHHFRGVTKMVLLGSGADRSIPHPAAFFPGEDVGHTDSDDDHRTLNVQF